MYYLIYKVTNRVNGKIYIGSHKTKNKNDGYMGSGKYLRHAINKHGPENFSKEILFEFDNATDMYAKEAEIVDARFLAEENTYNLKRGGFGGFDWINQNGINNKANQCSIAGKAAANLGGGFKGKTHSKASKELMSAALTGRPGTFTGKHHSIDSILKMSDAKKGRGAGDTNSQFGTMWITNGSESVKIKKIDSIPAGWRKGRVIKIMEDDLTGDVSLVLKTSGVRNGQGFDCTHLPPKI